MSWRETGGGGFGRGSGTFSTSRYSDETQRQALAELENLMGGYGPPDRIACGQELKRLQAQQRWRESHEVLLLMGQANIRLMSAGTMLSSCGTKSRGSGPMPSV